MQKLSLWGLFLMIGIFGIMIACVTQEKNKAGENQSVSIISECYAPSKEVTIHYPVIKNLNDSTVEEKINQKLHHHFIGEQKIFHQYHKTEELDCFCSYEAGFVAEQHNNVIIIVQRGYHNEGGAHGTSIHEVYHIDTRNGTFYQLKDLLKNENDTQRVCALLQKHYHEQKKELGCADDGELRQIKKDQCFTINDEGITLYFQPSEIDSDAFGFPRIKLAWKEIEHIIDTKSDFYRAYFTSKLLTHSIFNR